MYLHIVGGPWLNIFLLPLKIAGNHSIFFHFYWKCQGDTLFLFDGYKLVVPWIKVNPTKIDAQISLYLPTCVFKLADWTLHGNNTNLFELSATHHLPEARLVKK